MVSNHAFCWKITKNSDPLGTLKNFRKKVAQCRKNQKGDPLASAGFVGYVKKVKTERGTNWRQKNFQKKSHIAEKKFERGDSLVPSGFVGYLEKVKNERGEPLH